MKNSEQPALVWVKAAFLAAIPGPAVASVIEWAEHNVRLVGSTKTETFDRRTAPWLNDVIECAIIPGRYTLIKPIQSGGTTAGEIILCFWISTWNTGDCGYFWPSDEKALDRWDKYTCKRLMACQAVMERASPARHTWTRGLILFPHLNFAQLGVRTDRNVSSDTLRGVVNEELHDVQGGWEPGKLDQVYGRQRAVWNALAFNISNASRIGDQLHQAFESGTQEEWEVKCPSCGLYHPMRTRWEDERPDRGGLRYNADGARRPDGNYDYNKIKSSIRFQMPCGGLVNNSPRERRALSESGRYSEPHNKGALPNHRSFRLEAVAVHDVDWLDLIIQKHKALKALKGGDPSLFEVYQREQECVFWDTRNRPLQRPIVLSSHKKNRDGLPDRAMRLAAADYQRGVGDDTPHWWLVIRDFKENGDSLLVYEGRCADQAELVGTLASHKVEPLCVCIDSGYEAKNVVYPLCLSRGYCCIKVEGERSGLARMFRHANQSEHIFSEPQLLYTITGGGPSRENPAEEPRFWLISKWAAMERLAWLRSSETKWELPQDVSEDYKAHLNAWTYSTRRAPTTGEILPTWKQLNEDDHLLQCEVYLLVAAEMEHLIGDLSLPDEVVTTG